MEQEPVFSGRYKDLVAGARGFELRTRSEQVLARKRRWPLIAAIVLVPVLALATLGVWFMHGHGGVGPEALRPDAVVRAVVNYSPCSGAPSLASLVDRSVSLDGAPQARSVEIVENNPRADRVRVDFVYKTAATTASFIFHPRSGRVEAASDNAAAALRRLQNLCASQSGAPEF